MAAGSTKQKLSCEMHVVRFNVKYYPLTLKEAQKLNGVKALVQKYCYGSNDDIGCAQASKKLA